MGSAPKSVPIAQNPAWVAVPWALGLSKHSGAFLSCATRVPAVLPVRSSATLQAFWRARPGGHAAMVPAKGIPLALHALLFTLQIADALHGVPRRVFAPQRGLFIILLLSRMDPMTLARAYWSRNSVSVSDRKDMGRGPFVLDMSKERYRHCPPPSWLLRLTPIGQLFQKRDTSLRARPLARLRFPLMEPG